MKAHHIGMQTNSTFRAKWPSERIKDELKKNPNVSPGVLVKKLNMSFKEAQKMISEHKNEKNKK